MVKKMMHKIFNLILFILILITVVIAIPNRVFAANSENNPVIFKSATPSQVDVNLKKKGYDKNLDREDEYSNKFFKTINNSNFTKEFKYSVAQWYYILRYLSIAAMLAILIVLGIKLALASIAEKKALYKRMLLDWFVGFILIFTIHYFMIFILYLNETLINIIREVSIKISTGGEYSLYETVRSRAYDIKFTVGTSGMIMYITLVYFTIKYVFMYTKRFITIVILTILAPVVVVIYAIKKVLSGKTNILTTWMEEYAFNVLLQTVHALMYAVFVGISLRLAETTLVGIIMAFIVLNMMTKCEAIFRKIFKFSEKGSLAEETANTNLADDIKSFSQTAIGAATVANVATKPVVAVGKKVLPQAVKPAIKLGQLINDYPERRLDKLMEERAEISENREGLFGSKEQQEKINKLDEQIKVMKDQIKEKKENKGREGKPYNFVLETCSRFKDIFDVDNYLETAVDKDGNVKYDKHGRVKKRIVRKEHYRDKNGKKISYGGIESRFKKAKRNVFALTSEDRKVINNIFEFAKSGALGAGGIMIGLGSVIANPKVGIAVLSTSVPKYRKFSSEVKRNIKMSWAMKQKVKKETKEKNKAYTFKQFSTKSKYSIDEALRNMAKLDPNVEHIEHIKSLLDSGGLKASIALLPFTLTGTKGVLGNGCVHLKAIAKQTKKNAVNYERGADVILMQSLTEDVIEHYQNVRKDIYEDVYSKEYDLSTGIKRQKLEGGITFNVNNKMFTFRGEENELITTQDLLREALVRTGMSLNVYNLSNLDLTNIKVVTELEKHLKSLGQFDNNLMKDKNNISNLLYSKNGINDLKKYFEENNPDLLKNRLYQKIVGDYMQENGITTIGDSDLLKIRQRYLNKISDSDKNDLLNSDIINFAIEFCKGNLKDINIDGLIDLLLVKGADSDDLRNNIEEQISKLDENISEIVMSSLVNNRIIDITNLDLSSEENKSMLEEIINSLKASGLNISEEEVLSLAQSVINSAEYKDLVDSIAKEEINKFIDENYQGNQSEFFNDEEGKNKFNEYIDSYLDDYFNGRLEKEDSSAVVNDLKNLNMQGQLSDQEIPLDIEKEILENRLQITDSEEESRHINAEINEMKLSDSESRVEELLRQREVVSRENRINDIMDAIKDMREEIDLDDPAIHKLFDDSVSELEDFGVNSNSAEKIINLMLKEKCIRDDAVSLKMYEDSRKNNRMKRYIDVQESKTGYTMASRNYSEMLNNL